MAIETDNDLLLSVPFKTRQAIARILTSDIEEERQDKGHQLNLLKQQGWDARDDPVKTHEIDLHIHKFEGACEVCHVLKNTIIQTLLKKD